MSKVIAIAGGALRFAAAIIVGVFLLYVMQFTFLLSGSVGRTLMGWTALIGLPLVFALAIRFALSGNVTRIERTAATATTGMAAAALLLVCIVSGIAFLGTLGLMGLFWLARAGSGTIGDGPHLAPYALGIGAVFVVTALGSRVLVYSGYRMWTPRPTARWLTIGTFLAVYVALFVVPRFTG